jgi:radical SAM protein with 4Fe4S-binding SPASM domain
MPGRIAVIPAPCWKQDGRAKSLSKEEIVMIIDALDRWLEKIPLIYPYYFKRAALLKKNAALLMNRMGWLKPYTFVQWLVTNRCNMKCPFCESSSGQPEANELDTSEAKSLIDDLAQMGVKRLLFSGGEPLTRPDIVELMGYADSRSLKIGLVTNGYRVQELWNEINGFDYFLYFTSLDGPESFHNRIRGNEQAFSKSLKALDLFKTLAPVRMVNTAVYGESLNVLPELLPIVKQSGANAWHLCPITNVGRAEDDSRFYLNAEQQAHLIEFIQQNRRELNIDLGESHYYLKLLADTPFGKPPFCGAGLTRCAIMANGDVIACQQIYDRNYTEGNIRQKPFSQLWRDGFKAIRRSEPFMSDCRNCALMSGCQGGCWAEMMKEKSCQKVKWDEWSL